MGQLRRKPVSYSILMLLALFPFIQVGFEYYYSVQSIFFLIIATYVTARGIQSAMPLGIVLFAMMFLQYFISDFSFESNLLLRTLREYVCLMLLLAILNGHYVIDEKLRKLVNRIVVVIAAIIPIILFIQIIGIASGKLLFMPADWMAANSNTLPGELALEYTPEKIRPCALWGEPSYLGFFVLSMLVIALNCMPTGRLLHITIGLLSLSLALSQTLSGVLAFAILIVIHYWHYLRVRRGRMVLLLGIAISGAALYISLVPLEEMPWWLARLSMVLSGDDSSGVGRLFTPFELIGYTFSTYPLGLPLEMLPSQFWNDEWVAGDNGLLNLFIEFGFVGFLILVALIVKLYRQPLLLPYVLLSAMFNGAFLAIDKVSAISLVIILASSKVIVARNMAQKVFQNSHPQ